MIKISHSSFKLKRKNKISFLDVLLITDNSLINTKVYHKNMNADICINWKSFGPNNWEWGTLKTLVTRA